MTKFISLPIPVIDQKVTHDPRAARDVKSFDTKKKHNIWKFYDNKIVWVKYYMIIYIIFWFFFNLIKVEVDNVCTKSWIISNVRIIT